METENSQSRENSRGKEIDTVKQTDSRQTECESKQIVCVMHPPSLEFVRHQCRHYFPTAAVHGFLFLHHVPIIVIMNKI